MPVFPLSWLLSVGAADELPLHLQLQECRWSRRLQAQGHSHYGHTKTSCSGRAYACVPVWDFGLEALLTTAPAATRGSQPQAARLPFLCTEHSTNLFQCVHGRRGVYLVYSGKSRTFPRNYNAWKYCWLRHREENVQTWLAYDALTCSFCLGPTSASFLEDCSLMGEMMAKGPAVRSMEWLTG